jgi:RNA polymerase sigma-70 factor (ECF subfamily)
VGDPGSDGKRERTLRGPAVADGGAPFGAADEPSDEELMVRYQRENDQGAATILIERYSSPLGSYLRRLVGESAADDLLQATFLRIHEHRKSFKPGHAVHAWIYSIATHAAIDWMRRASHARSISLEGPPAVHEDRSHGVIDFLQGHCLSSPDEAQGDESRENVRKAIERLSPHLRCATNLVDMQGLSYADASQVLHIPVGTVKSRIHQARRQLRHDLEERAPTDSQSD